MATEVSTTIEFNASHFPSIIMREDLLETWNDISLASLEEAEKAPLMLFLEGLGAFDDPSFDQDKILLVKASRGIPESIYTPGIFKDGDKIIVKVGVNTFAVTQTGDKFTIGTLIGKMNVTEAKDRDGNPYPKASMTFISQEHDDSFSIPVNLASKELGFTRNQLDIALLKNKPIVNFLLEAPASAMKMQELEIGEYQIKGASSSKGKYGALHTIHLLDGRKVLSAGNATTQLNSLLFNPNWEEETYTLVVDTADDGSLNCAIRKRLPMLSSIPTNSLRVTKSNGATATVSEPITVKATSVDYDNETASKEEPLDF